MKKEFICMNETIETTQKKIRTWVSSGYEIEIISQFINDKYRDNTIITSLWRWKN